MKITIHAGHGFPGKGAIGAVGFINESLQARIVAERVVELLRAEGHQVENITVDQGSQQAILNELVVRANHINADLNVSIHFNASNGNGHGTEVYFYPEDMVGRSYAKAICLAIEELGFENRGAKQIDGLYFISKTKGCSILIECCFVDSKIDTNIYDADKMAVAIATAINGKPLINAVVPEPPLEEQVDLKPKNGAIPVMRLYNPNTGEHVFVVSTVEANVLDKAGWNYEGIGWYAPFGGKHVYRLYNVNNGDHMYTLSEEESAALVKGGWHFEGFAFASDTKETYPVYRLYNENAKGAGSHHFTTSETERDTMVNNGWKLEGILCYAKEV